MATPPPQDRSDEDVLPDVTSDERPVGWGDDLADEDGSGARSEDDDRLVRERPPHWDGE
jgi:hypothetical protein